MNSQSHAPSSGQPAAPLAQATILGLSELLGDALRRHGWMLGSAGVLHRRPAGRRIHGRGRIQ